MEQLVNLFPKEVNNFYEPFVGGGTVFLNVQAKKYLLNDLDSNLINIQKFLIKSSENPTKFFKDTEDLIREYGLSCSYRENIVPDSLKKKWKKTYFARFNKNGYEKLRTRVNMNKSSNPLILYILLIYGFNRMLRFNGGGKFNLPVGNVDFNKNVIKALNEYFTFVKSKEIFLTSKDFRKFLSTGSYQKGDFVYFDPPYIITASEYNKFWNEDSEHDLLETIDALNKTGVKFALSNVTHYKAKRNNRLIDWMKKYFVHKLTSNYINYHNNRQKQINEVLITNYDK